MLTSLLLMLTSLLTSLLLMLTSLLLMLTSLLISLLLVLTSLLLVLTSLLLVLTSLLLVLTSLLLMLTLCCEPVARASRFSPHSQLLCSVTCCYGSCSHFTDAMAFRRRTGRNLDSEARLCVYTCKNVLLRLSIKTAVSQ